MDNPIQVPILRYDPLDEGMDGMHIIYIHLLVVNAYATRGASCVGGGFQLDVRHSRERRPTHQDDGGRLDVPGNLLHKEPTQASYTSTDEIAPAFFPGHIGRGGEQRQLLPLSYPALTIPIANVWCLRPPLVLVQQGKQFLFPWFSLYLYQLPLQLRILLLCRLEHTSKRFKQGRFFNVCHYDLYQEGCCS